MTATESCKEKTPNEGNLCRGPSLEMHNVATTISSIVAETIEGDPSPNKRLEVCTKCQHLYKNCEVVLTPASLCYNHLHLPEKESSRKDVKKFSPSSPLKPWNARRYEGICHWDEARQVCTCGATDQHLQMTRARLLGPRFKKMLLIGAACLPFIFLIAYLVLTYI